MTRRPTGTDEHPADPYTDAMLAGAEVEHDSTDGDDVVHHPRTSPANHVPPERQTDRNLLTTDDEAQIGDSVIQPGNS